MNEDLQQLYKLLQLNIPENIESEDGFLEIVGLRHYENINSRIYAYFLDQKKNADIASLFLESILELIHEKTNHNIVLHEYDVFTEVSTKKGNRIDLVLDDVESKTALIIENKIYHFLDNDLEDYWKHYQYPDTNKTGVILTLYPLKIEPKFKDRYVNITHIEWVNQIKPKGFPSNISHKNLVYLNDFFNTMTQLTKSTKMDELTEFYFNHAVQINKAVQTEKAAIEFISGQLEKVAGKLGWNTYGRKKEWRNIWDKENDRKVYYTIILEDLMQGQNKINIIIELEQPIVFYIEKIKQELPKEELKKFTMNEELKYQHYVHFLRKEYTLSIDDLKDLAGFILNKITNEFEPTMDKIIEIVDRENKLKEN